MLFTLKRFFKNHKKHQLIPVVIGAIVVLGLIAVGGSYAGFLKTQLVVPAKNNPISNAPFPRPSTPTTPTTPSSTPPANVGAVVVRCEKRQFKQYELQYSSDCKSPEVRSYQGQRLTSGLSCGPSGQIILKGAVANASSFTCRIIDTKNGLSINRLGTGKFTPQCVPLPDYYPETRDTCNSGLYPVLNVNGKGYRFTLGCGTNPSNVSLKNIPTILQEGSKGSPATIANQLVCGTFAN